MAKLELVLDMPASAIVAGRKLRIVTRLVLGFLSPITG